MSMRHYFCSIFSNFRTIFAIVRFMPKTSVKIAWHETNDIPTSSATLSRPSLNRLYHNWTCVLLIVDAPFQGQIYSSLTGLTDDRTSILVWLGFVWKFFLQIYIMFVANKNLLIHKPACYNIFKVGRVYLSLIEYPPLPRRVYSVLGREYVKASLTKH